MRRHDSDCTGFSRASLFANSAPCARIFIYLGPASLIESNGLRGYGANVVTGYAEGPIKSKAGFLFQNCHAHGDLVRRFNRYKSAKLADMGAGDI